MKEIIAKCGYRCDLCPAFTENIRCEADRQSVSDAWRRLFGFEISLDQVECAGCHNQGNHPDSECPVRPCVLDRKLENCALCQDFECDSLKTRTGFLDDYLKKQDIIISEEDYQRYVKPYESRDRLIKIKDSSKGY